MNYFFWEEWLLSKYKGFVKSDNIKASTSAHSYSWADPVLSRD